MLIIMCGCKIISNSCGYYVVLVILCLHTLFVGVFNNILLLLLYVVLCYVFVRGYRNTFPFQTLIVLLYGEAPVFSDGFIEFMLIIYHM